MVRRSFLLAACILSLVTAVVFPCMVHAETNTDTFSFSGATWGMSKEDIRSMIPTDPYAEPEGDAPDQIGLMYIMQLDEEYVVLIQYCFDYSSGLYCIEIMNPRDEGNEFYNYILDQFTIKYGIPTSVEDVVPGSSDPAQRMMTLIKNAGTDIDIMGWNVDPETVIVLSREPDYQVTYVEIRQYKHYF